MAGGRPTKYKEEYCEKIIEYMSKGNSLTQFAASIDVTRECIYEWSKNIPEFSYALRCAKTKCESYWENIVKTKTVKKMPGSDGLLTLYMKNRFGWSDKIDQNIKSENKITYSVEISEDGTVQRNADTPETAGPSQ